MFRVCLWLLGLTEVQPTPLWGLHHFPKGAARPEGCRNHPCVSREQSWTSDLLGVVVARHPPHPSGTLRQRARPWEGLWPPVRPVLNTPFLAPLCPVNMPATLWSAPGSPPTRTHSLCSLLRLSPQVGLLTWEGKQGPERRTWDEGRA